MNSPLQSPKLPFTLGVRPYLEQVREWPASGRHIMAQYDDSSIIVYQAYRPSIASYAVEHQRLGGDFSYSRMSWIKPNFLWMMYRSGWAAKEGQEHILALRLPLSFFDELLGCAVASTFNASGGDSYDAWTNAVAASDVRLQWDPDHGPRGDKSDRRAIQLGLRAEMLRRFGQEEILSIEDITPWVISQRDGLTNGFEALQTPIERRYCPLHPSAAIAIGLDH